jgi:hypothetical protein
MIGAKPTQSEDFKGINVQSVIKELQMITGKSSKDLTYLYHELTKEGLSKEPEYVPIETSEFAVDGLDDWFDNLGGEL